MDGGGQGDTEWQRKHTIQKTSRAENGGRRWREVEEVVTWKEAGWSHADISGACHRMEVGGVIASGWSHTDWWINF